MSSSPIRSSESDEKPTAVQMRSIRAGSSPVSSAASRERARARRAREEVLEVAVGEPAGAGGLAQRVERVPALAQARDDARLGDGGRRPAPVAERDDPVLDPAAQRGGRDLDSLRDLAERQI